MTAKEVYNIWAPFGKKWTHWARPVAFVAIDYISKPYITEDKKLSDLTCLNNKEWKADNKDLAIIVDMSGDESVRAGIYLAQSGFRPVPIYNGTVEPKGARATVDNQSVATALKNWAEALAKINIKESAGPAFLLDSNRLNMYQMDESMYDNSWDVYPQDLPSPQYFLDNGIKRVLVVGRKEIARDLKKILFKHQKNGIDIYHTKGYEEPEKVRIRGKKID